MIEELILAFLTLSLEFLNTLLKILGLIDSSKLSEISYNFLQISFYSNLLAQEIINATANNQTAVENFGKTLDFLGSNATKVFGDLNGSSGMSYILNKMSQLDLESFASKVADFLANLLNFLNKALLAISQNI